MNDRRAVASDTTFETHLLASCLIIPFPFLIGGVIAWAVNAQILGLALLGIGALLVGLCGDSVLRIDEHRLEVRMLAFRGTTIDLHGIERVFAEATAVNLGRAPAIRIVDAAGQRASICLGWWQREDQVLAHVERAVLATGAVADKQTRQLLRHKPPAAHWIPRQQRLRRVKPRPYSVRPIDYAVARVAWASILLGAVVVVMAVVTSRGVGSFGVVPEVIAGFVAIDLGVIARLMSRPPVSWGRTGRGTIWALLVVAVLATATAVVTALDPSGSRGSLPRMAAELLVIVGRGITIALLVAIFVQLTLAGLWFVWRSLEDAGGDRWFR